MPCNIMTPTAAEEISCMLRISFFDCRRWKLALFFPVHPQPF
jgi:hypothetical protein